MADPKDKLKESVKRANTFQGAIKELAEELRKEKEQSEAEKKAEE